VRVTLAATLPRYVAYPAHCSTTGSSTATPTPTHLTWFAILPPSTPGWLPLLCAATRFGHGWFWFAHCRTQLHYYRILVATVWTCADRTLPFPYTVCAHTPHTTFTPMRCCPFLHTGSPATFTVTRSRLVPLLRVRSYLLLPCLTFYRLPSLWFTHVCTHCTFGHFVLVTCRFLTVYGFNATRAGSRFLPRAYLAVRTRFPHHLLHPALAGYLDLAVTLRFCQLLPLRHRYPAGMPTHHVPDGSAVAYVTVGWFAFWLRTRPTAYQLPTQLVCSTHARLPLVVLPCYLTFLRHLVHALTFPFTRSLLLFFFFTFCWLVCARSVVALVLTPFYFVPRYTVTCPHAPLFPPGYAFGWFTVVRAPNTV